MKDNKMLTRYPSCNAESDKGVSNMFVISGKVHLTLMAVLLVGLSLSFGTAYLIYKEEEKAIYNEFQKDVDQRAEALYRMIRVKFETLHSLTILFNDGKQPSAEQFSQVAQSILNRHKGIQALEWIPRVPHAQRAAYVKQMAERIPGFDFTEREQQGIMVSALVRDQYFPVYYIEPLTGNEMALGFDLGSSPARLQTLRHSLINGLPRATASITLVQAQSQQKGFLAMVPIYTGTPTTFASREALLRGFILGVFRISDIFKYSAHTLHDEEIDIRLLDSSNTDTLLHHKPSHSSSDAYAEMVYRKTLPDLWGRIWVVEAIPSERYVDDRSSGQHLIVAISGLLFTLAISFYIYFIARQASLIQKIVVERTQALKEANDVLHELSVSDALTGLANRRSFDEYLSKEWKRAIRNQTSISLLFLDVDCFKAYNDHYGHLEGDTCLQQIAEALGGAVRRPSDLVARYGGEEFAIIMPDTDDSKYVAEKCRRVVEMLALPHVRSEVIPVVTVSIGIATLYPKDQDEPNHLILDADRALYTAKAQGRNRIHSNGSEADAYHADVCNGVS